MKRKKERIEVENVEVVDIAAEGKAIAKINDMVVFIPQVIPGDIVNIYLKKKKKNYAEGVVLKLVKESPRAESAFCTNFGICGGCKWQRLPYSDQLKYKCGQVFEQLTRIGKLKEPKIHEIIPSSSTLYYRNKLEFTFSNKRWLKSEEIGKVENTDGLGFHVAERFDKVLDIDTCYLQPEPSNKIRKAIRQYTIENCYEYFDIREQNGLLRNLIIRTSESSGEIMLIIVFYREDEQKRIALLEYLKSSFPEITSLFYVINAKGNDTLYDQDLICYFGKPYIEEKMEELTFRVSPKSFYQTNSLQAYELYKVVRNYASLTGKEIVYDLYTGTGTIANFVASNAQKVVGIEYVPEAIEDAKINSTINNINNTCFFAGDIKDILTETFVLENGNPEVVILDPPRAGLHPNVIEVLLKIQPYTIVYVSCNPATQARDLLLLSEKYNFIESQPVDMFPHTHHIENVALLKIK